MKRLFTYISMLVLAVACETMYGPVQTPIKGDKAGSITVTVDEVKDNSVTFTVSPASESAYYSYMVQAGDEAVEVDATTLYSNGYKKTAVASAAVKWTAEKTSTTVTVSKLASNTTYQIYAVAGSPMGFPGEVYNTSFKTSDVVAPVMSEDYESADSTITFTFSEPVVRGTGALTAKIYAMNSAEIEDGVAVGSIPVDDAWIKVNGASVSVTVEGMPAGAFYTIDYPEGAFKDVCGNVVAAVESAAFFGSDTDYEPVYVGLGGRNATKNFTLGQIEADKFASAKAPAFLLTFNSEYGYGYTYTKPYGKAVYTYGSKTTSYDLTGGTDYDYVSAYKGVVLQLPASGDPGNTVELTIAEGAFEDYFGNVNAKWTDKLLYSYGYTLADAVGTYAFRAPDNMSQSYISSKFVIEESDNAEKGNIMITSMLGIPCMANIYGTFDVDAGTLTFNGTQKFFQYVDDGETPDDESDDAVISYYFYTYSEDYYILNMPESGLLSGPNDYLGIAIAVNGTLSKYAYLFLDMEAQKVEAAESAAPSSNEIIKLKGYAPVNPR